MRTGETGELTSSGPKRNEKMDERLYTIPLGKAYESATIKRANKAVSLVRAYITRHSKVSEVSISGMLNRYLWKGSRKHPPRNVKIKVIKDGDKAMAYLPEEEIGKKAKKEEPKKAETKEEPKKAEGKEEKKEAPKETAKEEKKPEAKPEKKEEKPEKKEEEKPKEEKKETPKAEEKPKEEAKEEKK